MEDLLLFINNNDMVRNKILILKCTNEKVSIVTKKRN
jgi:hypothetical protein